MGSVGRHPVSASLFLEWNIETEYSDGSVDLDYMSGGYL